MKNLTVAKRYARALYEVATAEKVIDDVLLAMSNIDAAIKSTPDLTPALLNPLIKPEEKQQIIKSITTNKLILRFAGLLARRKRMDLLGAVYEELLNLSDLRNGIHRVLIKTARALTDKQKKAIEKDLGPVLGGKVVGRFEMAKELIGGIWLKMGDKVLDATLKRRVEDLRHTLIHSTN